MVRRLAEATNACRARRTRGEAGWRRLVVRAGFLLLEAVAFFVADDECFFALELVFFFGVVSEVLDADGAACAKLRLEMPQERRTEVATRTQKLRNESYLVLEIGSHD
jgi:hypothetical protein